MIVRFNPQPVDLQRLEVGPIGPHLRGFAALIAKQNYSSVTGWLKMRLVAKFSRWLQQHRISLKELNEARIGSFLNARHFSIRNSMCTPLFSVARHNAEYTERFFKTLRDRSFFYCLLGIIGRVKS